MKRVLLVNTNIEKLPYPIPPLGICLLASALEPDYTVKVYDGVFDEGKNLPEMIREFTPDYIGFSIRNIDDVVADRHIFYPERIVSDFIKPARALTIVPFILGGSGFSIFPEELMKLTSADYGICGEGERSLRELLRFLDKGKEPEGIPGLISRSAHKPGVVNAVEPEKTVIPHSFIDKRIDFLPYVSRGVYSIQTRRGCIHHCIYCNYPCIEGRNLRMRDPADVVMEMREASERLGDVTFEFVDSTFNDPPGFAESICREIIRNGLKLKMRTMGINPRNISGELFDLMVRAGFTQIDVTPDSASPLMLKRLGKGFSLAEIQRTAELIKKADIPAMWFFLFGGLGENEQTFYETLGFIDSFIPENDLVYMNAGMRIYPGTPLHSIAVREGVIPADSSLFYPPVYYYSAEIGKERLNRLISEATKVRLNCIPALETQPPPELLREAALIRREQNLTEPMFRTLLRLRRERSA